MSLEDVEASSPIFEAQMFDNVNGSLDFKLSSIANALLRKNLKARHQLYFLKLEKQTKQNVAGDPPSAGDIADKTDTSSESCQLR